MCLALSKPPSVGVVVTHLDQNMTDDDETTLSEQDQRPNKGSQSEDYEHEDTDDDEGIEEANDDQEK